MAPSSFSLITSNRCFSHPRYHPRPSLGSNIATASRNNKQRSSSSSHSFLNPTPKSLSISLSTPLLTVWGKDWSQQHSRRRTSSPSSISASSEEVSDYGIRPFSERLTKFINVAWRFSRPYSLYGMFLGGIALFTRVMIENPTLINWSLGIKALYGLIAIFCAGGSTNGINDIFDVDIDRVNKPHFPLASGELSIQSAWALVLSFAVVGVAIVGLNGGPHVTFLYCLGLFLGTNYSAPPVRLKRFVFGPSLYITTILGFLLNYGLYHACRGAFGLAFKWSIPFAFLIIFDTIASLVIAITKDLPDVEGDRKYGVSTLAASLGIRNTTYIGVGLFLANYIGSILVAICIPQAFRRSIMIPAHALLAVALIFQTRKLEKANYSQEAIAHFYQFIWKLFYAEYIMFPLI